MAAAPSTAERELQLLEKVEFKILGVANKEAKLHDLLQVYLPPVILKAGSEHASVRAKVIQMLGPVKTFIQPPEIKLPLKALLEQYKSQSSVIVKQLDLSFIQHSLERVDDDDRRALIPIALAKCSADWPSGDSNRPPTTFFQVVLRLLLDLRIPPRGSKDDEAFREAIGLSDPADATCAANLIGLFIRLHPPTSNRSWEEANPTFSKAELGLFTTQDPASLKIYQRIAELKAKMVAFLASAAFTDEERFFPALYATANANSNVSSTAEEIIKRNTLSLEDSDLVTKLYDAHYSLSAAHRIRILGMLSKSAVSVTMLDKMVRVVCLDLMSPPTTPHDVFVPDEGLDTSQVSPQIATVFRDLRSRSAFLFPQSSLERTKLHKALFQYLSWVARVGIPEDDDSSFVVILFVRKMVAYIEQQGWPMSSQTSSEDIALRCKAYETIGSIARGDIISNGFRLDTAEWLFKSLAEDPIADVVVNIDGALSSLTSNMPALSEDEELRLRIILLHGMYLDDDPPVVRSIRHAVVRWGNECLPFSSTYGRWIDILAVAGRLNETSDVTEQGRRGLDPWTYFAHSDTRPALPSWMEMVETCFGTVIDPGSEDNIKLTHDNDFTRAPSELVFRNFSGRLPAFAEALKYCKQIMFITALENFHLTPDWMQALASKVQRDLEARTSIRDYLRSVNPGFLTFYLRACMIGATSEEFSVAEECLRCFVDVAALSPAEAIASLARIAWDLLPLNTSHAKETRHLAARAFGILMAHPAVPTEQLEQYSEGLQLPFNKAETLHWTDLNEAEGSLLAFGHLRSRTLWYDHFRNDSTKDEQYPRYLLTAEKVPASLLESVMMSFSQLWTAGLALPPRDNAAPDDCSYSISKVVERLAQLSKKGDEKAIFALGRLAAGWTETDAEPSIDEGVIGSIMQALFNLHEIKGAEVQFTVGDAITAAVARWSSDFVKLTIDIDVDLENEERFPRARTACVTAVLDKLFKDCKATKPSLLKASGIWLFCMVQYCSHLPEIQSRLREAQAAFMRLLNVKDELVQETASRGLTLVYEKGDADLKSTLVKDLVAAFTGTSTQLKVEEETELFDAGALPTGEGKSVTSYKDIVSLANEVGDQTLVYKFMSLAANAATWSTRSAFGRFGLSNILSESEIDPRLYPKLYRYRFDPNTNVQKSMDDIWKALVKDTGAVLDAHFDDILNDLLGSILGREWRMREASCAAISDLLQGRPFPQYSGRYQEIWQAALKVLDDVKGSVREAALRLCMALSKNIVRQLEENNSGLAAKAMLREALPFLLSDKGIESSVKDVQIFATITIMDIAKKGGVALKPFIPDMVPQLLGLLSTIEPEQINYHYQRAGEDSRDQIDKLRSQMVNRSPISEAIENSLRFIDAGVMAELAPKLEATIKNAIGMPTKIGCSRVLATLFTRHVEDVRPVANKFLQIMQKQAMDKNDEVSQAYARAAAYIVRVVSDSAKDRFCDRLLKAYLEATEETRRQKVADVVLAWGKVSPDHFTAHETQLLPFSYLGLHDTDEYTSKIFKEVWSQHAGSSRTVIRYVPEIVALVEKCLDTTQWPLRHAGAFTVASMVSDVADASEATGQISEANLEKIWPVFDQVLAVKTFPGKEKLLESFPKFVEKGHELWKDDKIAAQMKKIAIREAKRNNDEYRVHAFACLWKFAEAREDLDILQEIADIVKPYMDEHMDEDKMDVDSKGDLGTNTAKNGFEAIARGYNHKKLQSEPRQTLGQILSLLDPYLSSIRFNAIKREVWYKAVYDMLSPLSKQGNTSSSVEKDEHSLQLLRSLDLNQAEAGTESQRIQRVKAVSAVLGARAAGAFGKDGGEDLAVIKEEIDKAAERERSLKVQQEWKDCKKKI